VLTNGHRLDRHRARHTQRHRRDSTYVTVITPRPTLKGFDELPVGAGRSSRKGFDAYAGQDVTGSDRAATVHWSLLIAAFDSTHERTEPPETVTAGQRARRRRPEQASPGLSSSSRRRRPSGRTESDADPATGPAQWCRNGRHNTGC
jgi:hypothetical protein